MKLSWTYDLVGGSQLLLEPECEAEIYQAQRLAALLDGKRCIVRRDERGSLRIPIVEAEG